MDSRKAEEPELPRGLIGRRGVPTGKGARLPSLKTPRDLTLGGVPKKVFTPNIPVKKEKPKDIKKEAAPAPQQSQTKSTKPREGRERGRGGRGGRGRGHDRHREGFYQSESIFAQGPAEQLKSRYGSSLVWDGNSSSSTRSTTSRLSIKKEEPRTHTSSEILDQVLRDDFISDLENKKGDLAPVGAPLTNNYHVKAEPEKGLSKIKIEDDSPMEVDGETERTADTRLNDEVRTDTDETSCKDQLLKHVRQGTEQLFLLHLPHVLPGMPPPKIESERGSRQAGASVEADSTKNAESGLSDMPTSSLADFTEGYIGKLQIRRSGRKQLVLGNITLDVDFGTTSPCLQELVSIRTDGNEPGHMTVLGHIQNPQLICMPNFETLLKDV